MLKSWGLPEVLPLLLICKPWVKPNNFHSAWIITLCMLNLPFCMVNFTLCMAGLMACMRSLRGVFSVYTGCWSYLKVNNDFFWFRMLNYKLRLLSFHLLLSGVSELLSGVSLLLSGISYNSHSMTIMRFCCPVNSIGKPNKPACNVLYLLCEWLISLCNG